MMSALGKLWLFSIGLASSSPLILTDAAPEPIVLKTDSFRCEIGADGRPRRFVDNLSGQDHLADTPQPLARLRKAGREHPAAAAQLDADGRLRLSFPDADAEVLLQVLSRRRHLVLEVVEVKGEGIEELTFCDLELGGEARPDESFAACALALNLQTNVHEIPGANRRLRAMCYPRFGMQGAAVALVGAPALELRNALQEAVEAAPDLPHSPLGGPWAMDAEINRGSYLFNFGDLSEEAADEWIRTAKACGMNQIDFHGGSSFRFGDIRFNPQTYPRGPASMKAVIDKLHAAGIKAGLHTYAFFIDKSTPWVTPVPDPRLGKDATFTLSAPMNADATVVPVDESTERMSTTTGFFVRNSVTLHIDDELIIYSGISKEPPYAFTQCQRGAYGTKPAAHAKGAKVHHLKECFGYFMPDGDSTLFAEVAAHTAEAFNTCGFDMMYLDALDGEDLIGGHEASWHYGSKFVFEIWKRLKRPALMEMSTFHHHLWYVRSRYIAWDTPNRGHKPYIDIHVAANESSRRMFLPGHLGWWRVLAATDIQTEPTFSDDIEYLGCKAIGTDTGFSLQGVDPTTMKSIPAVARLSEIMRQYEELRHQNYFPDAVKTRLRQPGKEFTLVRRPEGGWAFRPLHCDKHKVSGMDGWSNVWTARNPFERQPVRLRIEALMSAGPYDAPDQPVIVDFNQSDVFKERATAKGLICDLTASDEQVKTGGISGRYTANSEAAANAPAWTSAVHAFSPPLNIQQRQALGVWIHGDGKGEVLNFQLRSPEHLPTGFGEHYVDVDFTGWRYFELIEPEGDRCAEYNWPYGGHFYDLYREHVDYSQVASLGLWYNNVPAGGKVKCHISPIKALPLVKAKLIQPMLLINGQELKLPVTLESGSYVELLEGRDCKLYGANGELLREVALEGDVPAMNPGENRVELRCGIEGATHPRARVTIMTVGEPL
ncbi:MAG: hypothetical protein AMXMBFR13_10610 [Phycisphaerae bacterium]